MPKGYFELDEAIMKRLTRADSEPNIPGFRHEPERRAFADTWVDGGKASPSLRAALDSVRGAEDRIRKARIAGLRGAALQEVREAEARKLLQRVERERADKLRKLTDEISSAIRRHRERSEADATRALLELERSKLEFSDYKEQEALGRLKVLRERGRYSEADLLVLGAKGRKAKAAARDLERDLPAGLSDEHGRELLEQASRLVDLPTGVVEYKVGDSEATQQVSILSLFDSHATPSPADLMVEA